MKRYCLVVLFSLPCCFVVTIAGYIEFLIYKILFQWFAIIPPGWKDLGLPEFILSVIEIIMVILISLLIALATWIGIDFFWKKIKKGER